MNEPWLARHDWASGRVREQSSSRGEPLLLWLLGAAWMGGLSLLFLVVGNPLRPENHVPGAILAGLIVLGGLMAWGSALFGRLPSGPSVFEMAAVPGVIGGTLAGVIRTSQALPPLRQCAVSLLCVRSRPFGRGTSHTYLWQDEVEIAPSDIRVEGSGSVIPVAFEIPSGLESSRDRTVDDFRIQWHLHVFARRGRGRYETDFVVPVFVTSESRAPGEGAPSHDRVSVRRPASSRVRIEETAAGTMVHLPLSMSVLRWIVGPPLAAALLAYVVPRLSIAGVPLFEWPSAWAFGIAIVVSAFAVADVFNRPTRIEIADGQVIVRSGPGARRIQEQFAVQDVRDVTFSATHGVHAKVGADVCTLARVPLREQRWLASELRRMIGPTSNKVRGADT